MKTAKKLCLFLAAICLSLSACGASNIIPDEKNTQDNPNVTAAESEKGVQAEADSDFEALDSTADTENLYDFTPILSENDIDYMGIPYGELTAEQFIQLWAQCTQKCNVQRLYVISYCNYSDKDFSSSEEAENYALKEYAETLLHLELIGRILFCYSDVELIELEDAPEGYYDRKNDVEYTDELHYLMTCKRTAYEHGEKTGEFSEEKWITLKKSTVFGKSVSGFHQALAFFKNQHF